MIHSYTQLTGKYLRANRKRTLLTIIGIIMSLALISSIGLFMKGLQEAQIEDIKNTVGAQHLMFTKTNADLVAKVTSNPKVARSGFLKMGKKVKINTRILVNEVTATDQALELLPYRAKAGRLPENDHEVAIEKWVLRYIDKNAKVGTPIKINDKTYTLTGILEDNIDNQAADTGVLLTKNNKISKENAVLLVEISPKTNLRAAVKELKQLGTKDTVVENTYLLAMEGGSEDTSGLRGLYIAVGVIIGIVLIATFAVIYNTFQISVVERIKQFGLLRAVGATPKQIRKIVLREATILTVIGVPLGLLCGIAAIWVISVVFKFIGRDSVKIMNLSISPWILGISALVGIIAIYCSALIPAYFAGRVSPLVAISSRALITKEKIKRGSNRLVGKVFGFEGLLAMKNIKRNRKRYRITVFSIIISVVLFITFKSFMDMSLNISSELNESKNINFTVVRDQQAVNQNMAIDERIITDIKALPSVAKVYKVYNVANFGATIGKNSEVKKVQDIGTIYQHPKSGEQTKTMLNSSLEIYDPASLAVAKKYLQAGDINLAALNKANGVILINKNIIYNQKTERKYYGPVANLHVGDEITLQAKAGQKTLRKVKVMAILKTSPFNFRGSEAGLKLITTEAVGRNLTGVAALRPINLSIKIKDVAHDEAAKSAIEDVLTANPSLELINNIDNNRNGKSAVLMVQILLYGFVVVISLIGSVNIINTLTTNIILRRREFATLKSIGLTQRGLRKMIVTEGLLYGIAGTLYGGVIGCGLSYVLFKSLSGVREFGWQVPWGAITIAAVCAILIGYLSVLSPLARIKKDNLIEVVREEY